MNRQLHPTTSPPGLDRRELFFFSPLYHALFISYLPITCKSLNHRVPQENFAMEGYTEYMNMKEKLDKYLSSLLRVSWIISRVS
jgi:hypothetical protein